MSMESTGLFQIRYPNLLVARSRATLETLQRLPDGKWVNGHIQTSRNPKHNALAHVVFAKLAEATGHTIEFVKLRIKAATGYADLIELPDGRLALHGRPMNFSAMGQQEFSEFWNAAFVVIFRDILPDMPRSVQEQIEAIIFRRERMEERRRWEAA